MTVDSTHETAPSGRSWPVRVLLRFVHRNGERRAGPVRRWLLAALGRDPARIELAAECRQCGEPYSVNVLRLSPRRARYWCRRCGAVVALTGRSGVRQLTVRPRPPAGSATAALPAHTNDELRQVMPAAMARWAGSRSRRPVTIDGLDKPAMYQLYKRWDAYLAQLPPRSLAELVVNGEPLPQTGLPAFSAVVGALHEACYRSELVVRRLRGPDQDGEALYERAEHARRWLATRAGELCWIVSRLPGGRLAVPDLADVRAAMAALRSGRRPDPVASHAARAAAFGTDGGPALGTLEAVYPAESLLAALQAYLDSRARPLRDDVLAQLTAPQHGRWPDAR